MSSTYTRILAVDDDPILLQVMTAFFTRHGIEVVTASNGSKALQLLGELDDIDLIVTDLHMPDSNGIELIDQLRQAGCRVPIAIVSSADRTLLSSASELARAYQLELVGAIGKPVNFQELAKLLGLPEAA